MKWPKLAADMPAGCKRGDLPTLIQLDNIRIQFRCLHQAIAQLEVMTTHIFCPAVFTAQSKKWPDYFSLLDKKHVVIPAKWDEAKSHCHVNLQAFINVTRITTVF